MIEIVAKVKDSFPKPKTRYYLAWSHDLAESIEHDVLSDSIEELCTFVLEKYKGQFTHNYGKIFHEKYVIICEVCPPTPPTEHPGDWDGNPVVTFGLK